MIFQTVNLSWYKAWFDDLYERKTRAHGKEYNIIKHFVIFL